MRESARIRSNSRPGEDIARGIAWFAKEFDARVEGAGACGIAAILTGKLKPEGPCAVVVSGGNIDDAKWTAIVQRD